MKPSRSGRDGSSFLCLRRPRLCLTQQLQMEVAVPHRHLSGHTCNAGRAGAALAAWPDARGGLCCAVEVGVSQAACPAHGTGAGAGGTLAASFSLSSDPSGVLPISAPLWHPSAPSSLGPSRRFVPRQGCRAALPVTPRSGVMWQQCLLWPSLGVQSCPGCAHGVFAGCW